MPAQNALHNNIMLNMDNYNRELMQNKTEHIYQNILHVQNPDIGHFKMAFPICLKTGQKSKSVLCKKCSSFMLKSGVNQPDFTHSDFGH